MRSLLVPAMAAIATAFPTVPAVFQRADNLCPALDVQDSRATCKTDGNINIMFGTDTINLGDRTIDDIWHQLAGVCHEHGQCDTNDVKISTQAWGRNDYEPGTITIQPDGAYQTWIRNGLLDTLIAAVKTIAVCEKGVYKGPPCNRQVTGTCALESTPYTQCKVPNWWGINYQGPNNGCPGCAPSFMSFQVSMETVADKLCENLLGAAGGVSTIAGAVTGTGGAVVGGVAAGIFSLAGLFCEKH